MHESAIEIQRYFSRVLVESHYESVQLYSFLIPVKVVFGKYDFCIASLENKKRPVAHDIGKRAFIANSL